MFKALFNLFFKIEHIKYANFQINHLQGLFKKWLLILTLQSKL